MTAQTSSPLRACCWWNSAFWCLNAAHCSSSACRSSTTLLYAARQMALQQRNRENCFQGVAWQVLPRSYSTHPADGVQGKHLVLV